MRKRSLFLLLSFLLILILPACGNFGESSGRDSDGNPVSPGGQDSEAGLSALPPGTAWQDRHILLDRPLTAALVKDGSVYGYRWEEGMIVITVQDARSGECLRNISIPEASDIQTIAVDAQGHIYILGRQDVGEAFWKIADDDKITLIGDFVLEDLENAQNVLPKGLYTDKEGNFYLWYQMGLPLKAFDEGAEDDVYTEADRIYVKDSRMETLFYTQMPRSGGSCLLGLLFDEEGQPEILARDPEGIYLQELRSTQEQPVKKPMGQMGAGDFFEWIAATQEGLLFCQGNGLCRYSYARQETEKLLDLSACGILPSDIIYLGVKGDAIEIIDNYGKDRSTEYVLLEAGESSKKTISLGVIEAGQDLLNTVAQFNRFSSDFTVQIVSYKVGEAGFDEGVQRLKLDILRDEAPDILDVSSIDYEILSNQGAFLDLYPFMEQETEWDRSMLVEEVLKAYETDGRLYTIAPSFQLYSMWGKDSLIKGRYGVRLEQLIQILEEGGGDINSVHGFSADEPVLTTLCALGMDEFIDWEKGICHFEDESFRDVLEFAGEYTGVPADGSLVEKIRSGEILMTVGMISSVADYQLQARLYGDDISFIGYPSYGGTGTATSFRGSQLAVGARTSDPSAAWEFVKFYLMNGYDGQGFPVVREEYEKILAQAMEPIWSGEDGDSKMPHMIYQTTWDSVEIYEASHEDIETVKNLVGRVGSKYKYHLELQQIINEEADAYFSGQKSLPEVTKLIRNRAGLYLQE